MKTADLSKLIPEQSYIMFAGGIYRVAGITNRFGAMFIDIYDEPPSQHIDSIANDDEIKLIPYTQQFPNRERVIEEAEKWIITEMTVNTDDINDEEINKWCRKAVRLFATYISDKLSADADDKVTDEMIEKHITEYLSHECFDIELIGDNMTDNNNLKRAIRYGARFGAKAMRDGKIKPDADVRNEVKQIPSSEGEGMRDEYENYTNEVKPDSVPEDIKRELHNYSINGTGVYEGIVLVREERALEIISSILRSKSISSVPENEIKKAYQQYKRQEKGVSPFVGGVISSSKPQVTLSVPEDEKKGNV